jgi:hypothetical protein
MTDVLSRPDGGLATVQWAEAARKCAVEALGTFFLVFTVGAAVLSGSTYTPLAAGAVLMAMIYAGGHISGGHYNPAVTMAVLLRGGIPIGEAIAYWIAQFAAGVLAGAVSHAVVNPATVRTLTLSGHAFTAAAWAELLFTFGLVLGCTERGNQPAAVGQRLLRSGDRFHRHCRRLRGRRYFRRVVQPGRHVRRRDRRHVRLVDAMDLLPRRARCRGTGRSCVPCPEPLRQVSSAPSRNAT